MTGKDHNTDALIAALRSPALPAEQVGEAAAVSAMIEAQTQVPAASHGLRSRRGVAIAAVTVASLGIGGLAAAGPGIFSPAADQPEVTSPATTSVAIDSGIEQGETDADADADEATSSAPAIVITSEPDIEIDADARPGVDRVTEDPDVDCADGNHGQTVSSIAEATDGDSDAIVEAAQSACGMPDVGCAAADHGRSESTVVPTSEPGERTVDDTGRPDCAGSGNPDAPGLNGENGRPEDLPEPPGRPDDPGQPDDPGRPDDTPKPPSDKSGSDADRGSGSGRP